MHFAHRRERGCKNTSPLSSNAFGDGSHDGDHKPKLPRRHDRSCTGAHADLLCALPDEILIAILARVGDSRAAVSTSALSRRWRRRDHLPPGHAGTLHRYRNARTGGDEDARWALARQIATCDDRAMEAYDGAAAVAAAPRPRHRSRAGGRELQGAGAAASSRGGAPEQGPRVARAPGLPPSSASSPAPPPAHAWRRRRSRGGGGPTAERAAGGEEPSRAGRGARGRWRRGGAAGAR